MLLAGANTGRFGVGSPKSVADPVRDEKKATTFAHLKFKKLVDDEMRRLVTSREIYPIYDKWFAQPIPPHNKPLNIPVSYLLRDFWKYPTDQVPF